MVEHKQVGAGIRNGQGRFALCGRLEPKRLHRLAIPKGCNTVGRREVAAIPYRQLYTIAAVPDAGQGQVEPAPGLHGLKKPAGVQAGFVPNGAQVFRVRMPEFPGTVIGLHGVIEPGLAHRAFEPFQAFGRFHVHLYAIRDRPKLIRVRIRRHIDALAGQHEIGIFSHRTGFPGVKRPTRQHIVGAVAAVILHHVAVFVVGV